MQPQKCARIKIADVPMTGTIGFFCLHDHNELYQTPIYDPSNSSNPMAVFNVFTDKKSIVKYQIMEIEHIGEVGVVVAFLDNEKHININFSSLSSDPKSKFFLPWWYVLIQQVCNFLHAYFRLRRQERRSGLGPFCRQYLFKTVEQPCS